MQNVEAISRYTKLFYKFQSSLKKVKYSWIVFPYQLKEAITKKLDSVIQGWKNLAKDMAKVIKVICSKYSKISVFLAIHIPLIHFFPMFQLYTTWNFWEKSYGYYLGISPYFNNRQTY